jgi:hypothetical protein
MGTEPGQIGPALDDLDDARDKSAPPIRLWRSTERNAEPVSIRAVATHP